MQISKPDSHSPMCNWIVDVSHSIIPKHESEPVTMQNVPTLNDVDMQRLKAESLFLVSTTESSVDIGGTLEFAQCLHVDPIYCDEPSAIMPMLCRVWSTIVWWVI